MTLKTPKCGPVIDPTAYIYIYIYCGVIIWAKFGLFIVTNWAKFVFLNTVCQKHYKIGEVVFIYSWSFFAYS